MHQRTGYLWGQRFKSVLVEATPQAPRAMAAYIDLNPVRAGRHSAERVAQRLRPGLRSPRP